MAQEDFGIFKYASIKAEKGTTWLVYIYKKFYSNFIENWQFSADLSGWTVLGSNISHLTGGGVNVATGSGSYIRATLSNLTVGATYYVDVKVDNISSGVITPILGGTVGTAITTSGTHQLTIVAGSSNQYFYLNFATGTVAEIAYVKVSRDSDWVDSTEMNLSGEGFEITWNGQGGTRDRVFLGSELKLNVFVQYDSDETWLSQVMANGFQYHYIRVYKNSYSDANLWWYGWLQPSFDKFENLPYPYVYQLIATDSYGYFGKRKPDEFANQTTKIAQHKIKDILLGFDTYMDIYSTSAYDIKPVPQSKKWLRNSIDWWQVADYSATADPFDTYYISKGAVANETEFDEDGQINFQNKPFEYKESDVFNAVLKTFNTIGFLSDGCYNFIQPNTYASNTSGDIKVNDYNSLGTTSSTLSTLLTIDQNNHAILGGSTLTYEPSLESVRATFLPGVNTFEIPQGQDLTSSVAYGVISVIPEGLLRLNFYAKHKQVVNESEFSFTSPSGESISSNFIRNNSFQSQSELKIYITNDGGTTKHYLKEDTSFSNKLVWDTSGSVQYINIYRGYDALSYQSPINSTTGMAVGSVNSNIDFTPDFPSPGYSYYNSVTNRFHQTMNIMFDALIDPPTITGQIFIELDGIMKYWEARATYSAPSWTQYFNSLSPASPSFVSNTLEAQSITLVNEEENANNDVTDGLEYIAEQTEVSAFESLDLGSIDIGQTNIEGGLYSVNYSASGQIVPVTAGFQRNNPSPAAPKNITQLLVNEFIALQTEPLEILQADIQSADISPLKYIKYSINNDSNYKYYLFLGGTFKAQSEIMSGEWYRVNSKTDFITEPEPGPTNPSPNFAVPTEEGVLQSFQNNYINTLANNSIGKTSAALVSQTAYTQVTLSANVKGKYYSGQKISIAFPDGSNQLELTCSATKTGVAYVDVSSFTPTVDYPTGSIVLMRTADLTNVITGGGGGTPAGSDTQVQFNDGGSFGASGELTFDGTILSTTVLLATDTDESPTAQVALEDADGNRIAQLARIGSGGNAHIGQLVLRDNATAKIQLKASGSSYINSSSAKLGIGNSSPTQELDVTGDAVISGTLTANVIIVDTAILILPSDFIADDVGRPLMIDDSTGDRWLKSHSTAKMYASVKIPKGRKATDLIIFGSDTSAVTVYEATIDSDSVTSIGTGNIGTQINITDVPASGSNYLLIELAQTSTEKVYGGKVTIT